MLNKRICSLIAAFVIFIGIGTAAFAVSKTAEKKSVIEFGNLSSVLLGGGRAADYAAGMVLFSDTENGGCLTLRNTASGKERVVSSDNASYINTVGNSIYYISEIDGVYSIVKTTLSGDRKILLCSKEKLANLFVSRDGMYFLKGNSAVYSDFSLGTETIIMTEPQMKAFIPADNGIYWFRKNNNQSYSGNHSKSGEGTENEPVGYDCILYNLKSGVNTQSNILDAIPVAQEENDKLSSLDLTANVGGKTIPTAEYPIGSYFTDSGAPCTDHGTGSCGWENEDYCNCKSFHNGVPLRAVQCYAYARYIYRECFGEIGEQGSETSTNIGSIPYGCVTEENFKSLIRQTKPGAQLRVRYLRPNGVTVTVHSMIILDWNESGFSVLEANNDSRCGIGVRRISFSSYVPTLVSIEFLMMPDEYPDVSEEETSVPDIQQPSESVSDASSETETLSVSESGQQTSDTVTVTENTSSESGIYEFLFDIAEKILEFFATIVDILVSIL